VGWAASAVAANRTSAAETRPFLASGKPLQFIEQGGIVDITPAVRWSIWGPYRLGRWVGGRTSGMPSFVRSMIAASQEQAGPQLLGNRYALSPTIRQGAQATVTQAFDTRTGRLVAIKRVRFGPNDERAREGFQREVRMLQDLQHPNIVEMIDVDRDPEGNWYLVLEWVPENLEDLIAREGSLTWGNFWERLGHPLLEAIVFAQKRRIAHRDIKPKNILVTEGGVPKLARRLRHRQAARPGWCVGTSCRYDLSVRPPPWVHALRA
jgi:Protein kinase domain